MFDSGGIWMSKKDQFTFEILNDFKAGKITRKQAAFVLELSERSITRSLARMNKNGLPGILHGNLGRSPSNKSDSALRERVMALVRKDYFDFNMTHCLEQLNKDHGIDLTYSVFRDWCWADNLVKRKKHHRRKPRHRRDRVPCEGLMLQMDGSHHKWNGVSEWCLIAAIDDATSKIPYAEFFTSEDTINCMIIVQRIIEKYGCPEIIYVDRAGWFGGQKRQDFSQFKSACEQLGIKVLFANSPEAKGRIERTWDTFQDRIVPEMRRLGIKNIPAANRYLQDEFLPNYWDLNNTVEARLPDIRYRPLAPQYKDLNQVFCIKETRVVKGDHTISWDSVIYKISTPDGLSLKSREIELRTYQDLTFKAFFADRELHIQKIQEPTRAKPIRSYGMPGVPSLKVKRCMEPSVKNEALPAPGEGTRLREGPPQARQKAS